MVQKIENHELFPDIHIIYLLFAQMIDRENILVNVWERGAGLTKAKTAYLYSTAVANT